jgi:NADH dehydrogenase FAD-containing subunit
LLVDMAPRVLGQFSEHLSQAALKRLQTLGVEVHLGYGVDLIAFEQW